jgi:HNH endonuclease
MPYRNGTPVWNEFIWTESLKQFLKDNYKSMTNPQLAKATGAGLTNTRKMLYQMGLKRMELEYWTNEQIKFLKTTYKLIGDKELAEIFNSKWKKQKGWSHKHIEKKRRYLKLKRTDEQKRKIHQRNVANGRFAMCSVKRWLTMGCAPEGAIKIWNGYKNSKVKVIKVNGIYVHYAHWLYEKHFGKMPAGHVIGFKDRNNMNVVIENLECISRAEHARRNGIRRNLPADVRKTMTALNQLIHLINKKQHGKKN